MMKIKVKNVNNHCTTCALKKVCYLANNNLCKMYVKEEQPSQNQQFLQNVIQTKGVLKIW